MYRTSQAQTRNTWIASSYPVFNAPADCAWRACYPTIESNDRYRKPRHGREIGHLRPAHGIATGRKTGAFRRGVPHLSPHHVRRTRRLDAARGRILETEKDAFARIMTLE